MKYYYNLKKGFSIVTEEDWTQRVSESKMFIL